MWLAVELYLWGNAFSIFLVPFANLLKGVVLYTCLPVSKFSTKASSHSTPSGSRPEPTHAGNEPTKPCLGRTPIEGNKGNNNTQRLVPFDEGASDSSTAVNPRSMLRGKPVGPDLLDFDKQASHKASIKLEASIKVMSRVQSVSFCLTIDFGL